MVRITEEYLKRVIEQGDEGSTLLAELCSPTLSNDDFVEVLPNGIAGIRAPIGKNIVVHSAAGDPSLERGDHAESLVDRLIEQSEEIGALPVAFANVIDSSSGDLDMLREVASGLVDRANHHGVAILNGENAILGSRVRDVNVTGTMISLIDKELAPVHMESWAKPWKLRKKPMHLEEGGATIGRYNCGDRYAIFDNRGDFVFINADGVGTKVEFYERARDYAGAVADVLAMNLDDAARIGAEVRAFSGIVETNGEFDIAHLEIAASDIPGILGVLQEEKVGDRIKGHGHAYNINGSVVSTLSQRFIEHPLKPKEGDVLVAICGNMNIRSNGISARRKILENDGGMNWHEGRQLGVLAYLTEPSTILYPVFSDLVHESLASSVHHMSGGAWNGKLARPLAKEGLFVAMENLFEPGGYDKWFANRVGAKVAYAQWPMNTDGFITTTNPEEAIKKIEEHGLRARVVGQLEKTDRTGVEFTAYDGERVYFSG